MSVAMLLRSTTPIRLLALAGTLGALFLMEGATGARAASEAENNVLGKPRTVKSSPPPRFPVPASARPQHTSTGTTPAGTATGAGGATGTSNPARRVQAPAGIKLPHIATTTPQGATTPPSSLNRGATGTSTTPGVPTAPATATPGFGAPQTGTPAQPAKGLGPGRGTTLVRPASATRTTLSPAAWVAAALAALLVLICVVWGAARWYAYEPHWTVSLRHSFAEAGLRMSSTWEELADWTRLGR